MSLSIADLNATPLLDLTFKDVLEARTDQGWDERGRDAASKMRGQSLWDAVGPENSALIQKYIVEPRYQAKAARWVLRGAAIDRAILKGFIGQMTAVFYREDLARRVTPEDSADFLEDSVSIDELLGLSDLQAQPVPETDADLITELPNTYADKPRFSVLRKRKLPRGT